MRVTLSRLGRATPASLPRASSRRIAIGRVRRATTPTYLLRTAIILRPVRTLSDIRTILWRYSLISTFAASRPHAPQLPPIQSNMSPDSFYPQSATAQLNAVYNREARSPRTATNPNPPQFPPVGAGPVPKFEKVTNTADLRPKINQQPPFRRANPEGGFISVSVEYCRKRMLLIR